MLFWLWQILHITIATNVTYMSVFPNSIQIFLWFHYRKVSLGCRKFQVDLIVFSGYIKPPKKVFVPRSNFRKALTFVYGLQYIGIIWYEGFSIKIIHVLLSVSIAEDAIYMKFKDYKES